jgi:hypothetical protein
MRRERGGGRGKGQRCKEKENEKYVKGEKGTEKKGKGMRCIR